MAPQPFFSFHHANAFETADGKVVLDTVANLDGVDFSANFEVRSVDCTIALAVLNCLLHCTCTAQAPAWPLFGNSVHGAAWPAVTKYQT